MSITNLYRLHKLIILKEYILNIILKHKTMISVID